MTSKYSVSITLAAERDLISIISFIREDNAIAAQEFVDEIEKQIYSLEEFPLRCSIVPEADELGINYRHLIYGNYRTVFKVEKNDVYILRVLHASRLLVF